MKFNKSTISAIIIFVALVTVVGLSGVSYLIPRTSSPAAQPSSASNELQQQTQQLSMQAVSLETKDHVKIAADLYLVSNPKGWIIYSHMMPATKESWGDLADSLAQAGYEGIAVDLRGHGQSQGGHSGYKNFSDLEHQRSIADLEAAAEYLIDQRGAKPDKISAVGASIGANLSLEFLAKYPKTQSAVLLSSGLNYHGVITEPLLKNLKAGQKVFFVASRDDADDAAENQRLYDSAPKGIIKQIKIYNNAGHGTTMLDKATDLKQLIIDFISNG